MHSEAGLIAGFHAAADGNVRVVSSRDEAKAVLWSCSVYHSQSPSGKIMLDYIAFVA